MFLCTALLVTARKLSGMFEVSQPVRNSLSYGSDKVSERQQLACLSIIHQVFEGHIRKFNFKFQAN